MNNYQILNKEQFKRLCEHHRLVRILTDGKTLYAWNAEEAEHKEVRAKLHLSDEFIGFLFEKGGKVRDGESCVAGQIVQ